MSHPKIQFLVFDDCPFADVARRTLKTALDSLGSSGFEDIDLLDAATPDESKGWGPPTILVGSKTLNGSRVTIE